MRNLKNYISLILATILISCTNSNDVKVGFLFHAMDVSRWEVERKIFEEEIKKLGGTPIVKVADLNDIKQKQQAEELIEQGAKVIVIIAVNDATGAGIVRNAQDNGVKVVSYDGLLLNCPLDYFISFDAKLLGESHAKYALENAPNGNYAIINGDKKHLITSLMYEGMMIHLQPQIESNKVNLVYNGFMNDWSSKNARYYAEKIVDFSEEKVDAFMCVNDDMAAAVIDVLEDNGIADGTIVTGGDAELAACWRIMNGKQNMTMYKSSRSIATQCAQLCMKIAGKEKIDGLTVINNGRKEVPSLIIPPVMVTKSNMESSIVADGAYTMQQIMDYSPAK